MLPHKNSMKRQDIGLLQDTATLCVLATWFCTPSCPKSEEIWWYINVQNKYKR